MTPTELQSISVPTLIIQVLIFDLRYLAHYSQGVQADKNPLYPMQNAEDLQKSLVNVPGGAMIFTVKGLFTVVQKSAVRPMLSISYSRYRVHNVVQFFNCEPNLLQVLGTATSDSFRYQTQSGLVRKSDAHCP